jgi:hypothetical protein
MFAFSRKFATCLFGKVTTFLPKFSSKGATSHARKLGIGWGLLLGLGYVHAIEDDTIRNVRSLMNKHISGLRSEFGQTTVYPEVSYELKGDNYEIKFLIDQRKCDLFMLISTFMNVYNTDKQFRVTDMKAFSREDLITFFVEFEEHDPKFKSIVDTT